VRCQFGDWAWVATGRVVARRMRQMRVMVRLPLEEEGLALLDNPPFARSAKDGPPGSWAGAGEGGRPSDEAHISESRYGAPGLVAGVEEYGLALLDNPPFARSAKDGAPGSWVGAGEDGRPSNDAHISESRYGAPRLVAGLEEDGLALLDNPPFARSAKDGAPGLVGVPEFLGGTEVILGGSMVIIVGATGEKIRATV
jgi:hypothetical protein